MLTADEAALAAELVTVEGHAAALHALLETSRLAWAEREALRDRQEMVLRREAEKDEEELEQLRSRYGAAVATEPLQALAAAHEAERQKAAHSAAATVSYTHLTLPTKA